MLTLCPFQWMDALLFLRDDKSIRVWDVENGECLSVMEGAHSSYVMCVLLTSDQLNVISCGLDESIKCWSFDGRNLKLIWEKEIVKRLWRLCLSDDESMIAAVSSHNKHCFVLNRVDGTLIAKVATGSGALLGVCFAGSRLLCGGDKEAVDVIDVVKKSVEQQLTGPTGTVYSIAFCPSLDLVAAGTGSGYSSIFVWHLSTSETVTRFTGHTSSVFSLQFHPINHNLLISCSNDKSIRMWSVSDSTCLCCVDEAQTDWIRDIAISADGTVLSASSDYSIKKWSIEL